MSSSTSPESTTNSASPNPRLRLEYLDGIRGITALYVVIYHAYQQLHHLYKEQWEQLSPLLLISTPHMKYGTFAVVIFIVLSGYCLMLPVVRSEKKEIRGGLRDYFKRRSRRILPPYYAALFLSLLLGVLILGIEYFTSFRWVDVPHFFPRFSFLDVLSHLLVIHNLNPEWAFQINSPMWSVATEWQLYFLFPALLLPVWRRFGLLPLLAVAFLVGLAPHYLLNKFLEPARPWFLGLFALGMAAAEIGFSQKPFLSLCRKWIPWGVFALVFAVIACRKALFQWDDWIGETLAGIGAACLLVYCTRFITRGRPHSIILRLLEARAILALGAFSYSLYLVHAPVLALINQLPSRLNLAPNAAAGVLFGVGVPISVLVAYLFYLVCEQPFMSGSATKEKDKSAPKMV